MIQRRLVIFIRLGHLNTRSFDANSVVRQGDSLFATLFNICINDLIIVPNSLCIGININGRIILHIHNQMI